MEPVSKNDVALAGVGSNKLKILPPVVTILNADEYERAVQRIATLGGAKRGSVEEAIRIALEEAIKVWVGKIRGAKKQSL